MSAFRTVSLDEIEPRPSDEGEAQWLPVRDTLAISAFGVNAWRGARAGDEVIERHDERNQEGQEHEELYVVLRGHARFEVAGETLDAPAGTAVAIGPDAERHAVAVQDDTLVLTVGAQPGVAFEPSAWELRELAGS